MLLAKSRMFGPGIFVVDMEKEMSKYTSEYYNEKRMELWYGETSFKTILVDYWKTMKELNVKKLKSLYTRFSNMVETDKHYTERYIERLIYENRK